MMSQFEQRELARIEAWFREADPRLEKALAAGEPPPRSGRERAGMVAADVVAVTLLVLGLSTASVLFVLAGTVGLSVAVWLHLRD